MWCKWGLNKWLVGHCTNTRKLFINKKRIMLLPCFPIIYKYKQNPFNHPQRFNKFPILSWHDYNDLRSTIVHLIHQNASIQLNLWWRWWLLLFVFFFSYNNITGESINYSFCECRISIFWLTYLFNSSPLFPQSKNMVHIFSFFSFEYFFLLHLLANS